MVTTEDDPWVGRTFGRYRVIRLLARGGQSSIYEATDGEERVAVKVRLLSREGTPEADARLRREAVVIRRLAHPNVVRLLDTGETSDGTPWLAMELLEGESLAALLERVGTLSEEEILTIMAPVCEALTEAHRQGVVHRDLKPKNIMLVGAGRARVPKLLDFGIAGLLDAASLTSSITISGTPRYMAPEQWAGLKFADERSDVYSLGAIVYEALSGKRPFDADTPLAWMAKVKSEAPADLASHDRPVSPAFRSAVMKALARDPEQRPQTPMEFLRALQPAPGASAVVRARRSFIGAVVLGAVAVTAGGVGYFAGRPASRAPGPASGQPLVFLMDTPVARGVYDAEAVAAGATNADTISDLLRDLPIAIEKETIPSTWNREVHVLARRPAVIVIHRSAFFHGLNLEFGFGYEPFPDEATKARWALLYRTADDKLAAFMGLVAAVNPETRFIVYSRGTGSSGKGWQDEDYRLEWVDGLARRFPALKNHVTTIAIDGGVQKGSFKNPIVAAQMRSVLTSILGQAATD